MNRRKGDAPASRYRSILGGVALAFLAFFLAMPVAHAAENMRITFIRHGESEGNASGLIDTKTPGPVLTEKGRQEAQAVADLLGDNNYDAIYASQMVRTQQTAAPMSAYLGLPIQVLPGLQEIEAGIYEGTPESEAAAGYGKIIGAWAIAGQRGVAMPGTTLTGDGLDARVDGAIQQMYDKGDRNVAVFSHGGTIMVWTMMNASNLTVTDKIDLLSHYALGNTDYVVVEGNPEDGWILTDWNGKKFSPEPTFEHEVNMQLRTLSRQLTAAADQVKAAFQTGDLKTIATAINHSVADASFSVTKFSRAINAQIIKRVSGTVQKDTSDLQEKVTAGTENVKNSVNTTTDSVAKAVQSAPETETVSDTTKPADSASLAGTKSKLKTAADGIVKPRAATDLSDGNKALPGVTKSLSRAGEQVRTAAKEAHDQVSSSIKKLGDAVKKATGQTGQTGTSATSATSAKDSGAGSDTAGTKDAA